MLLWLLENYPLSSEKEAAQLFKTVFRKALLKQICIIRSAAEILARVACRPPENCIYNNTSAFTDAGLRTGVWSQKCAGAEAGLGSDNHIISAPSLSLSALLYLEAMALASAESVSS